MGHGAPRGDGNRDTRGVLYIGYTMLVLLVLALQQVARAAAAPPLLRSSARSIAATAAEQVAFTAQHIRPDATVAAALKSVGVDEYDEDEQAQDENDPTTRDGPPRATAAEQALAALGFRTALDLRLLAGGPEAAELMGALRTSGELRIGDRSKIRLLVGDWEHLARVSAALSSSLSPSVGTAGAGDRDESSICHRPRRLQDQGSGSDTLSPDSIAIVLSVLLGVCGYLLQAWTSHRAGLHATVLQREHDQEARVRQVEQDQAQAQMRRTERWVDDFCSPVSMLISEYSNGRIRFVNATANKLEAAQPEAFAELYKDYSMKGLDVKADGSIHGLGQILFVPNIDMKELTFGRATMYPSLYTGGQTGGSAAAVDVTVQDFMAFLVKHACCARELPQAFFDLMAGDVDGPLAEDYRGYIRHEVKPVLDAFKAIIHAHYAATEAPPKEWMVETFPGSTTAGSSTSIATNTVAYARAWDRVLAEWEAGRLDSLYPPSHMMPISAQLKFITWSRQRGETKQHELIGMSSGRRDEVRNFSAYATDG